MDNVCKFCGGAQLRPDMVEVGPLPGGTLYLHRDQTHPGRLLMVSARHVRKITDLSPEEYAALMESVYRRCISRIRSIIWFSAIPAPTSMSTLSPNTSRERIGAGCS